MNSSNIGLIILAAGASTRMGTPKQLLPYQGCSFIRHIAEVAICASSFRAAPKEQQRFAIASVYQPIAVVLGANAERIKPELSQLPVQIVEAYRFTGKPIIASEYSGTLGVPVLFSRALFSELMDLKSTQGAKQLIRKHIHEVFSVPFPEGAIDIDTPKDYEQFQALIESTQG